MTVKIPRLHQIQQLGLTILTLAFMVVLESKAALGAWHSVLDHIAALQHAALSVICSLTAIVMAGVATAMKHDERPHIARQARGARLISIALMLVPIGYLGASFKMDRQASEWAAYVASPAFEADKATAADPMADRYQRADAAARTIQPTTAKLDIVDFEFWLAAFFQIGLIGAASVRIPAPITDEERAHARRVLAAKKGVATRKRNASKKPAAKPAARRFGLLAGGKK